MPSRASHLAHSMLLASLACGPSVELTEDGDASGTTGPGTDATSSPVLDTGASTVAVETSATETGSSTGTADETSSSSGEALDGWCLVEHPIDVPRGVAATTMVDADVDGNGLPERWMIDATDQVSVWYAITQAPDGSFVATLHPEIDDWAAYVDILDVDGDGRDDAILHGSPDDPSDGYWRAGMPDGSFSEASQLIADDLGEWGQMDGDGIADRLLQVVDDEYVVELGLGDGSFLLTGVSIYTGWAPQLLPTTDIPGDFAVLADDGGIGFPSYAVRIYRLHPTLGPAIMGTTGFGALDPWAVLDVDDNGYLDIVMDVGGNEGLTLARGAKLSLDYEPLAEGIDVVRGAVGDFDGDGLRDLLWLHVEESLEVQLRRGAPGGFEAAVPVQGAELLENMFLEQERFVLADYDGDGRVTWVTRHVDRFQANDVVPCAG